MLVSLAVSYGVIACTLLSCDLFRNRLLPLLLRPGSGAWRCATDAVLGVELCATAFEMGAVIEHHGVAAWALALFWVAFYQVCVCKNV